MRNPTTGVSTKPGPVHSSLLFKEWGALSGQGRWHATRQPRSALPRVWTPANWLHCQCANGPLPGSAEVSGPGNQLRWTQASTNTAVCRGATCLESDHQSVFCSKSEPSKKLIVTVAVAMSRWSLPTSYTRTSHTPWCCPIRKAAASARSGPILPAAR